MGRLLAGGQPTVERQATGEGRPLEHPAHIPVMLERVLEVFAAVPAGTLVDGTLGRAGHAEAVLDRRPDLHLLGLDLDPDALAESQPRLARFGDRVTLVQARFDRLAEVAADHRAEPMVGVLLDLGVSSAQLDRPERGFSFRHDGPLDMRMDPGQELTAATVVNEYPEADLARVLRRFGDERYSLRIARAVVASRPLTTTARLSETVREAIPAPARRRGGHPARRAFQAIRIEVNGELDALAGALDAGIAGLAPGGRFAVLTYHSGEDRLVKDRFRRADDGGCTCPPGLPCQCGARPVARLLRRGGWTPNPAEREANPRSGSARLRAIEMIEKVGEGS